MKSDFEIAKRWKKDLKSTKDGLSRQYRNTQDNQAFYAGDIIDYWIGAQSTDQFGVRKRAMVQINKVKPYVNAVKGFMAQNRREAKYEACINGNKIQELYSDYANGMRKYVRARTYADQKETQQSGDMLICGYGAIETAMSYTNGQSTTDPNGQIIMGRLDPEMVGWDPFAKEPNLLDSRWCFYEQIYDLDDALDLFQDAKDDDFEDASDDDLAGGDGGYKFYARGGRYNKIKETSLDWSDQKSSKVKVYFYQWYEYETFYRADNPLKQVQDPRLAAILMMHLEAMAQEMNQDQQDMFAFDPKSEILTFDKEIKEKLLKLFPQMEAYEYRRKAYYSAVISKEHIFTKYRNPSQQGFTVKFKTGDYDSKNKIWTGMVNSMREPALYYNKALTELMFIIGSNSKGGVLVEEDAVDDMQKFEQQYSKTDAVVVVASGGLEKIREKKSPYAVTGYENIIQLAANDVNEVTGIDKTFLGSSENKQETGLLQARRIKQVCSTLACYFDSDTLYQTEHARLLLDFIRIYAENNDGGLFSILGENGRTQFLQISKDKLVAEYDVTIQEAPQGPEEKLEFAQTLTAMGDKLLTIDPATAKAIYGVAVKNLPLEHADQQQLLQLLIPPQGQINPQMVAKMQQQLQQLMSQATQTQLAEVASKANANNARALLDKAKIPEVAASTTLKNTEAVTKVHETQIDEYVAHKDPTPQIDAHT